MTRSWLSIASIADSPREGRSKSPHVPLAGLRRGLFAYFGPSFSFFSAAWACWPILHAATRENAKRNQRVRGCFLRGYFIVVLYRSDRANGKEKPVNFGGASQTVFTRSAQERYSYGVDVRTKAECRCRPGASPVANVSNLAVRVVSYDERGNRWEGEREPSRKSNASCICISKPRVVARPQCSLPGTKEAILAAPLPKTSLFRMQGSRIKAGYIHFRSRKMRSTMTLRKARTSPGSQLPLC